jgi:hypothetical protein
MRFVKSTALTTAFVGLFSSFKPLSAFQPTKALFQQQQSIHQSHHRRLQMSTSSTNTTPDVSQFLTGDRPPETKDYVMQQTMIRVKDPLASLNFYCNVLGFKLVMYSEFPQWGFNVYVSRHNRSVSQEI